MLLCLNTDILELIEEFMDVTTFCNWRFIRKVMWNTKHITKYATLDLKTLKKNQKCVYLKCPHQCLTELCWKGGFQKQYIPWCAIHVNPLILNDIDVYCVGGLDIDGVPLRFA